MGNKQHKGKSESSEQKTISDPDMEQARVVWSNYVENDAGFFPAVLEAVIAKSGAIGAIFGVVDVKNMTAEEKQFTLRFEASLKEFIRSVLNTNDWVAAKKLSEECGARHINYGKRNFQTIYWDVFVLSMTETLHERSGGKGPSQAQMFAWQKFLSRVVDHMLQGYTAEHDERKRLENGPKTTNL